MRSNQMWSRCFRHCRRINTVSPYSKSSSFQGTFKLKTPNEDMAEIFTYAVLALIVGFYVWVYFPRKGQPSVFYSTLESRTRSRPHHWHCYGRTWWQYLSCDFGSVCSATLRGAIQTRSHTSRCCNRNCTYSGSVNSCSRTCFAAAQPLSSAASIRV